MTTVNTSTSLSPEQQAEFDKWWLGYISDVNEDGEKIGKVLTGIGLYFAVKKIAEEAWKRATTKALEFAMEAFKKSLRESSL